MQILEQRADPSTTFACDMCGACCRAFPILASVEDGVREPRITMETPELPDWQQTADWHYRLHPLPFLKSCPFLKEDQRCSIYETRPAVCKRFQAGSSECQEARRRVNLPPLLSPWV